MTNSDDEELVLVESYAVINGKWARDDKRMSKAELANLAENLESEERLVYSADIKLDSRV